MAKTKTGEPNKSQAIRDHKKTHPRAKPKQISEALLKQGIKVSPGFVSTILSAEKKKKRKPSQKSGVSVRKPAPANSRKTRQPTSGVSFESLLKVKKIVKEIGGIEQARLALDALEQLVLNQAIT